MTKVQNTQEQVEEIIETAFPESKIISVTRIDGFVNYVLDVKLTNPDMNVIIKLGSEYMKHRSLANEAWCYEQLLEANINAPKIYLTDFSKKNWPFDVIVMEKLEGKAMSELWETASKGETKRMARIAGEFLARIHQIKFQKPMNLNGESPPEEFESMRDWYAQSINSVVKKHRSLGLLDSKLLDSANEVGLRAVKLLQEPSCMTLCHMDYILENIFFDGEEITGVIDWESACVNAPVVDFFKPHRWIFDKGEDVQNSFIKGYTSVRQLDENWELEVIVVRIHTDLRFIELLILTKQDELVEEYIGKVKNWIKIADEALSKL